MKKDKLISIELIQLLEFLNSIENIISLKTIEHLSIKDIEGCLIKQRFRYIKRLDNDTPSIPPTNILSDSADKKEEEEYSFECGRNININCHEIDCKYCIFKESPTNVECNLNSIFWKHPIYIIIGRLQRKRLWLLKILRKLKKSQYEQES